MANHVNGLDEIDMEYTLDAWGDAPPLTYSDLVNRDDVMSCGHARRYIYSANERAEITTSTCMMCALQSASERIAELEAERDAAIKRAKQAEAELGAAINQRNIAQRFVNENADLIEYWRDLFKRANAEKRAYRRERDAANKRAATNHETTAKILAASKSKDKIIAGLNQKIISANARAEQAEAFRSAFAEWILRQSEDVKFSAAMALGSEYLDGAK